MKNSPTSPYTTGLPVTTRRYLFLDDTFVESSDNVRRNFHPARRFQDKPLIVPDRPGDQVALHLYGTVLRDKRDNSFHMWYHSSRFKKDGQYYFICYAHSADGLNWEKPYLNLCEVDGSKANNVVATNDAAPGDRFVGYSPERVPKTGPGGMLVRSVG